MNKINTFDFTLRTLGPVHIGNGDKYTLKEYIYDNGNFYFPDMGQVFQSVSVLGPHKVKAFDQFLLGDLPNSRHKRLGDFLKEQNIPIEDFGGYRIRDVHYNPKTKRSQHYKVTNVDVMIKNAFNEPYIPGSSLKGAIRTVLVNEIFKRDDIPFGSNNDIFNKIRVSDSQPLRLDQLGLIQKINFNTRGKKTTHLPIHREAILPNTVIRFTITTIGDEAYQLIKSLPKLARNHYLNYHNKLLSQLPNDFRLPPFTQTLFIGGGSGFWTKVIINKANPYQLQNRRGKFKMVNDGDINFTHLPKNYINWKKDKIPLFHVWNESNKQYYLYEIGRCIFSVKEQQRSQL